MGKYDDWYLKYHLNRPKAISYILRGVFSLQKHIWLRYVYCISILIGRQFSPSRLFLTFLSLSDIKEEYFHWNDYRKGLVKILDCQLL